MKIKSLLIFALSVTLSFNSVAQSKVLYEKSATEKYIIRSGSTDNSAKRAILKRIGKGNSLSTNAVKLNFSFLETHEILKSQNNITFNVRLSQVKITGNTNYRGFPVGEFLLPSKMSLKMDWKNEKGKLLNSYTFSHIDVSGRGTSQLVNKTVTDSTDNEDYMIITKQMNFLYSSKQQSEFSRKADLIDQYYAELKTIKNKKLAIERINRNEETLRHLKRIEVIFDYRDLAAKTIEYAQGVEQLNFYTTLPLNRTDPENIKQAVENLISKSKVLLHSSEHIISELHIIYHERGLEMLARGKHDAADRLFRKSIKTKPEFAPPHYQIAKMLYNAGYTADAVNEVFEIRGMNPDPLTKQLTVELAQGIYNDYILEAADLNSAKKYDAALSVLNSAKRLCNDFPEVECRADMDEQHDRAIWGKFNILLAKSDNVFRQNKLYDAEQLLLAAKDYREQHIAVLQNEEDIARRFGNIYYKFIDFGRKETTKKDFLQALKDLAEARRICKSYREVQCSDDLDIAFKNARNGQYDKLLDKARRSFSQSQLDNSDNELADAKSYRMQYSLKLNLKEDKLLLDIKQKRYDNAIEAGLRNEKSENYKKALEHYDNAKFIASNYKLRINTYLNRYIKKASENYILQICANGERNVKANVLPEARQLYSLGIDVQTMYKQLSNLKVNKALSQLKDKIFKQKCVNAQTKYDNLFSEALVNISAERYIAGTKKLDEAIIHAQNFSDCSIRSESAADKKAEVADAVSYEKSMNSVKGHISDGRYQSAISAYLATGKLYADKNIKRFDITHLALYDFIMKEKDGFFTNVAAEYYTDKHDYKKGMELLKVLKGSDFKRSKTKIVQTKLGTALAAADFKNNPKGKWKTGVARYTAGDRYYKYLKRAYRKEWKRLD